MLTEIRFKNFKSFKEARLPLAPLTVLIGANAAGKSNAVEGLRLLAWLAQGHKLSSLQHAEGVIRGHDRVADLLHPGAKDFTLGCEIASGSWSSLDMTFRHWHNELHIKEEAIRNGDKWLYEVQHRSERGGTDVGVAYNNFARGRNKPIITCSDQAAVFTQLTSPATFGEQHTQSKKDIPPAARAYEKILSSMLFLDPVPDRMRDYAFPSDKRLQGDGANLSGVLKNLWGDDTPNQREQSNRKSILAFIQSLPEQEIADVAFLKEPRGRYMLQLRETFGEENHPRDAVVLSDGTLRVLAIAAAMLSAPADSLVVIEEVDNGLHPSRAKHLVGTIRKIAEERRLRVLISTHNPALLDAVPDAALPDVVYAYRDRGDGSSRLLRLADLPDYPALVAQGDLGDLVASGRLETFVKDRPSPEERKRRGLAWLEELRPGGGDV